MTEKEKFEIIYEDLDKDNKKEKSKSKSKLIIIFSLIGLIFISLIIFLIIFLNKKEKNNNTIIKFTNESLKLKNLKTLKTPFYYYNTTLLEKTISSGLKYFKAKFTSPPETQSAPISLCDDKIFKIFSLKLDFNEK